MKTDTDLTQAASDRGFFDSPLAQSNSCYCGPLPHEDHSYHGGEPHPIYKIPPGQLLATADGEAPAADVRHLHNQFRGLINSPEFPCIGAHAVFSQRTYRIGVYDSLAELPSVAGLGHDLQRFAQEQHDIGKFASFVAIFRQQPPSSHEQFAEQLYQHLSLLCEHDKADWDPHYSSDPENPLFAFSFAGKAFFVVGFNPHSPNLIRRFAYPALVFNPEDQIERLVREGKFDDWVKHIRQNIMNLQGNLPDYLPADPHLKQSEVKVYAGGVPKESRCPFHAFHRFFNRDRHADQKGKAAVDFSQITD